MQDWSLKDAWTCGKLNCCWFKWCNILVFLLFCRWSVVGRLIVLRFFAEADRLTTVFIQACAVHDKFGEIDHVTESRGSTLDTHRRYKKAIKPEVLKGVTVLIHTADQSKIFQFNCRIHHSTITWFKCVPVKTQKGGTPRSCWQIPNKTRARSESRGTFT